METLKTENEIIAEFMGDKDKILCDPKWMKGDELVYLRYHTSWDWLMPVVEKIESLQGRTAILFSNTHKHICTISERDHTMLAQKDGETKIEAVYKAVFEFIKWYNENNPKK